LKFWSQIKLSVLSSPFESEVCPTMRLKFHLFHKKPGNVRE